ncbi:J domain-containing protein [Halalkalirubrum salinum]|uniref:J domain-containing protein n=1 Tax=Halalkalirubrum salinum TaxID=2563889 RepID=UPI0010FADD19|nr:DnaJ domain-containing protein [Halalkalirubrum salinum]
MNDDPAPFYAMLRVNEIASTQEIETQFRRLVKQYHPDQGGSEDAYLRLQTARETLCSPVERRRYDRLGHDAYVKTTGAKRWIAWTNAQQSSGSSAEPTADTTTQTETAQADRQEASSTNSTTGATNAGRQRSSDDQGSTSTASKSRSYSRTDSASASDRKTEGTQTTGRSTDETTDDNTADTAGTNRDKSHSSESTRRPPRGEPKDETAHASDGSGFAVPRVLVVVVLAYAIAVPLRTFLAVSAGTISAIAVGFSLAFVFGNELRVYSQQSEPIDPQLSPRYAGYIAVCSGIGAGLMAIAVSHGSPNGGLLLGRFVLLFYIGLFVPLGIILFGVFYIGGNIDPRLAGGGTVVVLVGMFLIEFTPYRFWFPFTALATEPASTIAPWVDVGAASGFTVWWAVNIVLALLMSITLCIGIGTLLGLFSALLRGDNTNRTGHRIVGWELLASVPFVLLGWWHLAGNRLWVLHGIPPESTVAAGLILAVCCWPTVVFGAYSLVEQS